MDPTYTTDILAAADGALTGGGDTSSSWLDSITGMVTGVAQAGGSALGAYYGAQATANNQAAQQAYMAQLARTQATQGAATQKQVIYIGAALLMFVLLLRQTGQA